MPTYEVAAHFLEDLERLSAEQRRLFKRAIQKFVEDIKAQRPPRRSLGVKGLQGYDGVYEFRFAGDGRALFNVRNLAACWRHSHYLAACGYP